MHDVSFRKVWLSSQLAYKVWARGSTTVSTLVQVVHRLKRPPAISVLLDRIPFARVQATVGKVAVPYNQLFPGIACSLPA
jgi:hypothetical protein